MKKNMLSMLLIGIALFSGCKKNEVEHQVLQPIKINPGFTEYISAFTSGTIPADNGIIIQFGKELDSSKLKKSPDASLFKFEPQITGKAEWVNAYTIKFSPDNLLTAGQIYTGSFALNQLFDTPKDLSDFPIAFIIERQDIYLSNTRLTPVGDDSPDRFIIHGILKTDGVMKNDKVEQLLQVKGNGDILKLKWIHNDKNKSHEFTSEEINRGESSKKIKVTLDGNPAGVNKNEQLNFKVPSLDEFTFIHSEIENKTKQIIRLTFSDDLSEDISGNILDKITLGGEKQILNTQVIKNTLIISPKNQLTGSNLLEIEKGAIKSKKGVTFDQRIEESFAFTSENPQVKFIGKGSILPSSENGLTIPFSTVSLKAVDVRIIKIFQNNIGQFLQINEINEGEQLTRVGRTILFEKIRLDQEEGKIDDWKNFSLDLSKLIAVEPGAIYRVELSYRKDYYNFNCEDTNEAPKKIKTIEDYNKGYDNQSSSWDYAESYYDDDDGYSYLNRQNPCRNAYYNSSRWVSRNIMATNIGLIVKKGSDNTYDAYLSDIRTTAPIDGALVEAYNYQLQKIAARKTESGGHVRLNCKDKAFYLIATKGSERTYLKVPYQNALSVSMFDVSGSITEKGIKGYIYGERGVWRPGDTLHISFMMEDKNSSLPLGHPITFQMTDPNGVEVIKQVKYTTESNLYTFPVATEKNDITGTYNINIGVGGANFYKPVKIETVKPNRLKIKLEFPEKKTYATTVSKSSGQQEMVYSTAVSMDGKLEVKWLNGAIAKNLNTKIQVSLQSIPTKFSNFSDYTFSDPSKLFVTQDIQSIFDNKINDEGSATIPFHINFDNTNAPGMLQANILTRVFEKGGDFSIHQTSIPIAPYKNFVGLHTPKGDDRGMLLTDVEHNANIVVVDPDGNPMPNKQVDVTLYKVEWRWWWDISSKTEGLFSNSSYRKTILTQSLVTDNKGRADFTFQVKYPEWGRYFIVAKGADGHSAGKVIYIDWPGWAKRVSEEGGSGAAMLVFSTDKKTYNVGDKATLTIPSSEGGRALISIENSSKVLKSFWVNTRKDQTVTDLDITADMTPNVYVNISLLQPHSQTKNNLPIRMYGIVPIKVEDKQTILLPQIVTANEYRSGKEININVKEQNGKRMSYTLAVVDEGLLDLTNFTTPNPWSIFYSRESLGVRSWDIYDQVIGAYGGQIESLFAIGGGGEGTLMKRKEANRFKPVVKFIGPFELKTGATNEHKITLPDYIGSVRVMLVANDSKGAYGNTEKTVPVKQPIMVLATMPRVLGPNERIKLPVTVFCMDDKIKSVKVKVEYLNKLKAVGSTEQSISFTEIGDQDVVFDAQSLEELGVAKVKITASGGKESASQTIELNVRSANPIISKSRSWVLKAGESISETIDLIGIKGTNSQNIEFSTIPPINMTKRLSYLINYPHGCIEQTTSSVFPQLFLPKVVDIDLTMKVEIDKNIKEGIQRISSFQTSSGGFSYWPNENEPNDWGTSYAGNFLLEAESMGYQVPSNMKKAWVKYQKSKAISCSISSSGDALSQAYRLYTLALSGNAELGAMNRLRDYLKKNAENKIACWQLASAYLIAGPKEVSEDLLNQMDKNLDENQVKELDGSYGSYWRDQAKLLELLTGLGKLDEAFLVAKSISEHLNQEVWMSTQETAYNLMAMCHYAGTTKNNEMNVGIQVFNQNNESVLNNQIKSLYSNKIVTLKPIPGSFTVTNNGASPIYVVLGQSGSPMKGTEVSSHKNIRMEVEYFDMDNKRIDVNKLSQGTDFKARVTITNELKINNLKNMALTQIFPAGWEIINTRFLSESENSNTNISTYKDVRDDRVMSYFNIGTGTHNNPKVFEVYLTAAYIGTFYLPATQCNAMYDNTIYATEKGMNVTVTK